MTAVYLVILFFAKVLDNTLGTAKTMDWSKKSITITAYAETKAQSKLIDDYIANSSLKFKRVISRS